MLSCHANKESLAVRRALHEAASAVVQNRV